MDKEDSPAWQALNQHLSEEEMAMCLFIHDNTEHNIFLAPAYNLGIQQAKEQQKKWIVLLDQDTYLTTDFINEIRKIDAREPEKKVYVPILKNKNTGTTLSPFWISQYLGTTGGLNRRFEANKEPRFFPKKFLCAFNSCTMINMQVIDEVQAFDTNYPLEFVDIVFFYSCFQHHIPIEVLSCTLSHSLSLMEKQYINRNRYLSLMSTEKCFAKKLGICATILYPLTLCGRIIKWTLTRHVFVKETLGHLFIKNYCEKELQK